MTFCPDFLKTPPVVETGGLRWRETSKMPKTGLNVSVFLNYEWCQRLVIRELSILSAGIFFGHHKQINSNKEEGNVQLYVTVGFVTVVQTGIKYKCTM